MIPMGTTVQLTMPSEMQGRVLSLWYVGAGFMFMGPLPMAMVAERSAGKLPSVVERPCFC